MTDSDGYGRFHAPGPSDPHGGTYGASGGYGPADADPYAAPSGDPYASPASDPYGAAPTHGAPADPYAAPAAVDPYAGVGGSAGSAPAGYTGPEFGSGALPYGGPVQPQYYAAPPSNGAATASLVLGILSLTCLPLTGPIGLIFAIIGMKATADGTQGGRGMAIAGLVLGILGTLYLLFWVLYIVLAIVVTATTASM